MFDHVTIRASDRAASERFYDTVLRTLGIDESYRTGTVSEWGDFIVTVTDAEHPPTQRLHIGFVAPDRDRVHDFWRAEDPNQRMNDQINFFKNLALIGAALSMMSVREPWPVSVPVARPSLTQRVRNSVRDLVAA